MNKLKENMLRFGTKNLNEQHDERSNEQNDTHKEHGTRSELIDDLRKFALHLQSKYNEEVSNQWSLGGFVEHIEDCINALQNESEDYGNW